MLDKIASKTKLFTITPRPKTAPAAGLDKKPPRTPEKKPAVVASKVSGGDDWLSELTAKVEDETEFTPASKVQPRRLRYVSRHVTKCHCVSLGVITCH